MTGTWGSSPPSLVVFRGVARSPRGRKRWQRQGSPSSSQEARPLGEGPELSGGNGSVPQSGHTHPLLPPPGSLLPFPWTPHPPQEMGTTCRSHCRGVPKQDHCTPTRKVLAPTHRSQPENQQRSGKEIGLRGTSQPAGGGGGGTPWRNPLPHPFHPNLIPPLISLQPSPSRRE